MAFGSGLLFVVLSLVTLQTASTAVCTSPVVNLGYTQYSGVYNAVDKTTHFLGIRYAAPPTGSLRWKPPQAPATTSGIQKADTEPATCFFSAFGAQSTSPFTKRDPFVPSEDCLFLNVYTPGDLSTTKKLPVVVWIHGGGYMAGSASGFTGSDGYDGSNLITTSKNGVVVVVIQYRLGVFGFLPGAKVKAGGVLNAGLLDQQFALQWVQKNIQKFNGDPTRVTLWGQSAGAGSVLQHVIANDGKTSPPLFKTAMTSSVFLPSQYNYNDRISELLYSTVVSQSNCASASDTLNCLRTVDAQLLETVNVNVGSSGFFGTFVFVPVVDGTLIKQRPTEALKQKKINGANLLSVTNTFEGALLIDPNAPANVDVSNFLAQLFPNLSASQRATGVELYKNVGTPPFQLSTIMAESIFICPTYAALSAFGPGRGYKAQFAVLPAHHGDDLLYYFKSSNAGNPPPFNNAPFIKAFSQTFMDFAINSNPNVKLDTTITPSWNLWSGSNEMLFNKTAASQPDVRAIKTSPEQLARCAYWASVSAATAQ